MTVVPIQPSKVFSSVCSEQYKLSIKYDIKVDWNRWHHFLAFVNQPCSFLSFALLKLYRFHMWFKDKKTRCEKNETKNDMSQMPQKQDCCKNFDHKLILSFHIFVSESDNLDQWHYSKSLPQLSKDYSNVFLFHTFILCLQLLLYQKAVKLKCLHVLVVCEQNLAIFSERARNTADPSRGTMHKFNYICKPVNFLESIVLKQDIPIYSLQVYNSLKCYQYKCLKIKISVLSFLLFTAHFKSVFKFLMKWEQSQDVINSLFQHAIRFNTSR